MTTAEIEKMCAEKDAETDNAVAVTKAIVDYVGERITMFNIYEPYRMLYHIRQLYLGLERDIANKRATDKQAMECIESVSKIFGTGLPEPIWGGGIPQHFIDAWEANDDHLRQIVREELKSMHINPQQGDAK